MVHPILDKYYERDPYHVRSSAFVQEKGLVSNEKTPSGSISPAQEIAQPNLEGYRKLLLPHGASRSISPDLTRRSLTPISVPSHMPAIASSKPAPAQGNIKVKRRSVQATEPQTAESPVDEYSGAEQPVASDLRSPRKLSHFFPELTLASST